MTARRFGQKIGEPEPGSGERPSGGPFAGSPTDGSGRPGNAQDRAQGGPSLGFGQTPTQGAQPRPIDARTGFVGTSAYGASVVRGGPSADLSQDPGQDGLVPQVNLPKGGGAIRGIGESFDFDAFTGTARLSIPIYASPGRAGAPSLSLSYDSGAGNGPFGLGMQLSPPAVTRRTDRGLPQYADRIDSDTFVFSGAEHLVPALQFDEQSEAWVAVPPRDETLESVEYRVHTYRPRVEAGFARIERWAAVAGDDAFWRVTSADNVVSTFGRSPQARIVDPTQPSRIFTWLLQRVEDDRGNVTVYEYEAEDDAGIDTGASWEAGRAGRPKAQRYLKRMRYGNRTPFSDTDFAFEVVFDYGEHGALPAADEASTTGLALTVAASSPWSLRPDPFSNHRAGFEVRTYRRCQRVLMVHHFPELEGGAPTVVASTDFDYDDDPVGSKLLAVTHRGYVRTATDVYDAQAVPPLQLEYTERTVSGSARVVDPESLRDLGMGLDASRLQLVDLDGEGVAGLLYTQRGGWYYKRSRGGGRFEAAVAQRSLPGLALLAAPRLLDLDGDGQLSMVAFAGPAPGQYERTKEGDWEPNRTFQALPNERFDDPRSRLVDLTGDGLADLLVDRGDTLVLYRSKGHDGYADPIVIRKLAEGRDQPERIYTDPRMALFFADMTGDGLSDLVVARNGAIAYWPNLGYGKFGVRVDMGGLARFDGQSDFEASRLRLGDIDGSGTADLVYFDREGARVWFNASGNFYLAPQRIDGFPPVDNVSHADLSDLTGTGLADLVWSSSLPSHAGRQLRFVELLPEGKPYLLRGVRNNMGGERRFSYAPSTRFYLEAREAGTPWKTRLPFPVHVVDRVEQFDHVTGHRYVSSYAYHHGYFDGPEREFRGFGLVEQTDTESFEHFGEPGLFPTGHRVEDEALHVPPVRTRTWFHTGAFLGVAGQPNLFDDEYWQGDPALAGSLEHRLPDTRSALEQREALRALRGRVLRSEVYALDGSPQEGMPYAVETSRHVVRREQPMGDGRFGVFFVFTEEGRSIAYERNADDPRLTQQLTLEVDAFGVPTRTAAIAYPRRTVTDPVGVGGATLSDLAPQQLGLGTVTESDVTHDAQSSSRYRLAVPFEQRSFELRGVSLDATLPLSAEDVRTELAGATQVPFEDVTTTGTVLRLLSRRQARYYTDDLTDVLPLGQPGARALLYDQQAQAFTTAHITALLGAGAAPENLDTILGEGQYELREGAWWVRSGRAVLDPARFYLPTSVLDPFGNATQVTYDSHALLVTQVEDALLNGVQAEVDYRVLTPWRTTDPNGNVTEVAFDTLGQVVAVASVGKPALNEGDTLADPTATFEYDLFSYMNTADDPRPQPVWSRARTRERHQDPTTGYIEAVSYSSGTGNAVQTQVRVEAGLAPTRDGNGDLVLDGNGELVLAHTETRWVGSGRVIRNNKGLPIKQYEPFFSSTDGYETEADLVEMGVTPLLHYDPLGRLIRTDFPDGTLARVEFTPWRQVSFDPGDTVLQSAWHARESTLTPGTPENDARLRAAELSELYADTPTVVHLDPLGRVFLSDAHMRVQREGEPAENANHLTHAELDIQGNPLRIEDARGNDAETRVFGMLGQALVVDSIDAGQRRALADVAGRPLRAWNARGFTYRSEYDALNRPTHQFVRDGSGERLVTRTFYGEGLSNAVDLNLRGQAYRTWDSAGVSTQEAFDFDGNLLGSTRRLTQAFTATPDWSALDGVVDPTDLGQLDTAAETLLQNPSEALTLSSTWDALGRPVTQTSPDDSVMAFGYNIAGLLQTVDANIRGAATATSFVSNIDYDVRGRRERIDYGNGTSTTYEYDPLTLRLARLHTSGGLQDLNYVHDAVGNIVEIRDEAQQTVFFNNAQVDPHQRYAYDSLYRLIVAEGREHASVQHPTHADLAPIGPVPDPDDPAALRAYVESFFYDEVGNIETLQHVAGGGSFTREYSYETTGNRLVSNSAPGDPSGTQSHGYTDDAHGNMTSMPHLAAIDWDHADRMQRVDLVGGGDVYFVYDEAGNRVRKVRVANGGAQYERIYIGPYEVYRERSSGGTVNLQRETLHVRDDTGRICQVDTLLIDGGNPVTPANTFRYQYSNHLGSAQLEADENGDVISYEEFHPYGTTAYRAANGPFAGVNQSRYRYISKERDEETGLYHCGVRYYACWLGRWTAADPIGLGDGVNRFAYVHGNPVSMRDPSGTRAGSTDPHQIAGEARIEEIRRQGVTFEAFGIEPRTEGDRERPEGTPDSGGAGVGEGSRRNAPRRRPAPSLVAERDDGGAPAAPEATTGRRGSTFLEQLAATVAVVLGGEQANFEAKETKLGLGGGETAEGEGLPPALVIAMITTREAASAAALGLAGRALGALGSALRKVGAQKLAGKFDELAEAVRAARSQGSDAAKGGGLLKSETATALRSASEAYKGRTRLGHALSKHAGRHPEIWGSIRGAPGTWHGQAMKHFREIYRGPGKFERVTTPEGLNFIEKRLPDGRGIRLNMDHTFKGFVD